MKTAMLALLVTAAIAQPSMGALQSSSAGDDQEFIVQTMPALEGIGFQIGDQIQTTDAEGIASFFLPLVGGARDPNPADGLKMVDEDEIVPLDERTRAHFSRWRGGSDSRIIAQFNLEYQVVFELFDGSTPPEAVPLSQIDEVQLKSSVGEVISWNPAEDEPPWLLGLRIIPGQQSLEEKVVFWTVNAAFDSGLLVVNRNQTKFFPSEEATVRVEPVLYFSATFQVVDALFGFHTGTALLVETPNGEEELIELIDGFISIERLARGEYIVTVEGGGLRVPRPVAISRDQEVTLKLYTTLDLLFIGFLGLLFLGIPVYLGIRRRRRPRSGAVPITTPIEVHANVMDGSR